MNTSISGWLGLGSVSKRATDSLQHEREEIAAYKRECVGTRTEARICLAIDDDNARKAEVYGCGNECRRNGKADDVSVLNVRPETRASR